MTRPKLIHGLDWRAFYSLNLFCLFIAFTALWTPERILLLPLVYGVPWVILRWAGQHDSQWPTVYPKARRNRAIFYAGMPPTEPEPPWPRKVLFDRPRFTA